MNYPAIWPVLWLLLLLSIGVSESSSPSYFLINSCEVQPCTCSRCSGTDIN